jgi:hypothetical protein
MFEFILQSKIKHSKEVVMEKIKNLQPLNYNKFYWWRNYTDNINSLGKRDGIKERILNGDFEYSSYFWQAQLVLHEAKKKINLNNHSSADQLEILSLDISKHKRLMDDFEKEEKLRLNNLQLAFLENFQISKEQLENEMLNFSGSTINFFYYIDSCYRRTPSFNRKSIKKERKVRNPKNI